MKYKNDKNFTTEKDKNAYFWLELSGVCKRGENICIAASWSPKQEPSASLKL